MPSNGKARYSIDSSSVIHAWRRAYPPKNFESFWGKIEDLIDSGEIVASVEVLNEMKKKDDEIYKWCLNRPASFSVEIDDEIQLHLNHIMGTYPRLVDTVKGRSGGDPFVIALARSNKPSSLTVISEENMGKKNSPKIPDVCRSENIDCIQI